MCKSTSINKNIASSSGTAFKYIRHHSSAPARGSAHFSDEPIPTRTTEELSSLPPVATTNPLKMEAAPSAAADPPRNPRGSDGPTGNARGSKSGTRSLRTANVLGETLGSSTSTAVVLDETPGRGTPKSEGNLRGCDRSRLLGTANAFGEALGGISSASVLGETLGGGAPTSEGNSRGSDGLSRERAPARRSASEEPRFSSSTFFLEQRPVSSPPSPRKCRHTTITLFRKRCQSPWSHIPSFPLVPACPLG